MVEENKENEGQPFKQLFNKARAHLRVTVSAQIFIGRGNGETKEFEAAGHSRLTGYSTACKLLLKAAARD